VPGLYDHLYVVTVASLIPAYAIGVTVPRLREGFDDDDAPSRVSTYWANMAVLWVLLGLVALLWRLNDRPPEAIGLRSPEGFGWLIFLGSAVLVAGWLLAELWRVRVDPGYRAATKRQIEREAPFVPRTPSELGHFVLLAITAGVCEETIYRGYLIWYFDTWMNVWTAGVVSSILFGMVHAYQGPRGAFKVVVGGLVAAALYIVTGSLLVPVVLHAMVDILSGTIAMYATRDEPESASSNASVRRVESRDEP